MSSEESCCWYPWNSGRKRPISYLKPRGATTAAPPAPLRSGHIVARRSPAREEQQQGGGAARGARQGGSGGQQESYSEPEHRLTNEWVLRRQINVRQQQLPEQVFAPKRSAKALGKRAPLNLPQADSASLPSNPTPSRLTEGLGQLALVAKGVPAVDVRYEGPRRKVVLKDAKRGGLKSVSLEHTAVYTAVRTRKGENK